VLPYGTRARLQNELRENPQSNALKFGDKVMDYVQQDAGAVQQIGGLRIYESPIEINTNDTDEKGEDYMASLMERTTAMLSIPGHRLRFYNSATESFEEMEHADVCRMAVNPSTNPNNEVVLLIRHHAHESADCLVMESGSKTGMLLSKQPKITGQPDNVTRMRTDLLTVEFRAIVTKPSNVLHYPNCVLGRRISGGGADFHQAKPSDVRTKDILAICITPGDIQLAINEFYKTPCGSVKGTYPTKVVAANGSNQKFWHTAQGIVDGLFSDQSTLTGPKQLNRRPPMYYFREYHEHVPVTVTSSVPPINLEVKDNSVSNNVIGTVRVPGQTITKVTLGQPTIRDSCDYRGNVVYPGYERDLIAGRLDVEKAKAYAMRHK
jgi:hypothetical protein